MQVTGHSAPEGINIILTGEVWRGIMNKRLLSKMMCTALLAFLCAASLPVQTRADGAVDDKGNTILMTQSQRHKKFASKTNPKRDTKVVTVAYKPNFNGFTYADFSTCNSYNAENGLGGHPIYLLGTITDIEKVYENTLYYGTAICVNDVDGYQWYMRADIAKDKYDLFRNSFLGKNGYIFGIYSGYSGVTDRPMMDITVLWPSGMAPFDIKLYK